MTDELGPRTRALLDAARDGLSPDPAAVRRVRARIASMGAGAGSASGSAGGTALGTKLVAVVAAVAVAAGAGWLATRGTAAVAMAPKVELASPADPVARAVAPEQSDPRQPLRMPVDQPARQVSPAPQPPAQPIDDELITIEAPDSVAGAPRQQPTTSRGEPRRVAGAPPPARSEPDRGYRSTGAATAPAARSTPRPATAAPANLAREVELLDLAMAALRRGDASAALSAVQRHATETAGRGQLAEDAAAIEIEALCHLHDPTVGARRAAFDARFPRSAQRARLDTSCP